MNTILAFFLYTTAFVLAFFLALLIISAFKSAAESLREAMWENPPKIMGELFVAFAIFYLINIGVLRFFVGSGSFFREAYNLAGINGYGGYVGIGVLVFGAIFVCLGFKLDKKAS